MSRIPHSGFRPTEMITVGIMLLMLCLTVHASEKFEDSKLGFTMSLPSGFQSHPSVLGATPDIVHVFILGDPADSQPDTFLVVERMRGVLGRQRLTADKMPPGFKGSLMIAKWHSFDIDVIEVPETFQGTACVAYNAQVPLKAEAIQLRLFGPIQQKAELKALLIETLAGLDGESNWIPSLFDSSVTSSPVYWPCLLIAAIILIIGGVALLWIISRKTRRGTVLALAVVIYTAGWQLHGVRATEVRGLSGIVNLLGFVGVILGIIDLLRKRRRVEVKGISNKVDALDAHSSRQ